jgi:hypothetical protein
MQKQHKAGFVYKGYDVVATFLLEGADPSVGIMSVYAYDCEVIEIDGAPQNDQRFSVLLEEIEGETFEQDIQEKCCEAANDIEYCTYFD